MCWPEVVGGVEIEERRPKTWNEPRRKRLNFVRGHRHHPEEWVTRPYRGFSEQERWDRRRAQEMEQQIIMHPVPHPQLQGQHDPRILPMPHAPQQHHHIQPGQHGNLNGFDQHGQHGHPPQLDRRSYHSEDDIIGIEDSGDDSHDGHDGHDHPNHLRPRIIRIKPAKSHLPKGFKAHGKRSEGHKRRYSVSSSSSDGYSSPDHSSGFTEGFRAGRRSVSRRPVRRGRSRSRLTDDSFEDLMQTPLRSRSRRARR